MVGILLGTGGLVRAYTEATNQAIEQAKIVTEECGIEAKVVISYQNLENFKYFCKRNEITILETKFEETICCLIEMSKNEKEKIIHDIEEKRLNLQEIELVREKSIRK